MQHHSAWRQQSIGTRVCLNALAATENVMAGSSVSEAVVRVGFLKMFLLRQLLIQRKESHSWKDVDETLLRRRARGRAAAFLDPTQPGDKQSKTIRATPLDRSVWPAPSSARLAGQAMPLPGRPIWLNKIGVIGSWTERTLISTRAWTLGPKLTASLSTLLSTWIVHMETVTTFNHWSMARAALATYARN